MGGEGHTFVVAYAKVTKTYQTFDGAMKTFLKDFNFRGELPDSATTLKEFGGG